VTGASCYVGLDVGGTYLKAACLDDDGRILNRLHEPIEKATSESLLLQLTAAVRHLEVERPCAAVGIGLPGIVDLGSGQLLNAPNVPVLNGLRVGEEMTRRTGRRAVSENDANAAALAEAWQGAGRGADTVLFVTLGTGVGGALVIRGRIWAGKSGYAGEIGHIQVDPAGRPCGCGSWGCVETIAGAPGWVRRAEQALAKGRPSRLRGQELEPAVIVALAREADVLALEVVDETARAIGVGVAAALNLLNAERVVIGGGVARAGAFLLDRIAAETRRRTFPQVYADASFSLAELGEDAGVIGAGRVAMIAAEAAC
jgi:glucokinase